MLLLTQRHPIGLYLQHAIISGQGAEASAAFKSWAKESFDIATKIAYRNDGRIGIPKAEAVGCTMIAAAPVLPVGYVLRASRVTDQKVILAGPQQPFVR